MIPIRIQNPKSIEIDKIEKDLENGNIVIMQFSNTGYTDEMLSILNELCLKYDENFGIRFYGFHFDCKTLLKIQNIKNLSVDCMLKVDNIDIIAKLDSLLCLSLGVYELSEVEILKSENLKQLKSLSLSETKTKALNLQYLSDFKELEKLFIWGHVKNIESIGQLSKLDFLTLHAIKKVNVSFINNLKKLRTLRFIMGSRENINEIEENEIENLEITWVRGFSEFDNISKFKKLKTLIMENDTHLSQISFNEKFNQLKSIVIINCKMLNSIDGLENLPELETIRIYKTAINFETIINQKLSSKLQKFQFYTGKAKIDKNIQMQIIEKGYNAK